MPDNRIDLARLLHKKVSVSDAERDAVYLARKLDVLIDDDLDSMPALHLRKMHAAGIIDDDHAPHLIRRQRIREYVRSELGHAETMDWQELADLLRTELGRRATPDSDDADVTSDPQQPAWEPPEGYIGRKAIVNATPGSRFEKRGKNPSGTTIDEWVRSAERNGMTVRTVRAPLSDDDARHVQASLDGEELLIIQSPDTGENHYPECWIIDRIEHHWTPRATRKRNT